MSAQLVDTIYKALRLLPDFDGNTNVLTRFIGLCDQLVAQYLRNEAGFELSNLALLNGILNKITGPAARTINSNSSTSSWAEIRSSLINNFADQRDETSLYNDLSLLTQGNSTPQEFYESCQNLFSTIMTYVELHEPILTTREAKRTLYKKLTLQSYLRGLRDPLGYRIRCMRPETIEKALEFVHDELNTIYLQQRNAPRPQQQAFSSKNAENFFFKPQPLTLPPVALPPTVMPNPVFVPPHRPEQPVHDMRPVINRGPTRTQQMFAARPPNYRPQSNVFRLKNQQPGPFGPSTSHGQGPSGPAPQPMSGVSHYVTRPMPVPRPQFHDWSRQGNPPPTNYLKSRQLNFNDVYDPYPDNFDYVDNNYYYTEYDYEPTYYDMTYEQIQPQDYIPAYVEETDVVPCEPVTQDFHKVSKSEKPK